MESTQEHEKIIFEETVDLLVKGVLAEVEDPERQKDPQRFRFENLVAEISRNDQTRGVGAYLVLRALDQFIKEKIAALIEEKKQEDLSWEDVNIGLIVKRFGEQIFQILRLYNENDNQFNSGNATPLTQLGRRINDLVVNSPNIETRIAERTRNSLSLPNWDYGLGGGNLLEFIEEGVRNWRSSITAEKISLVNELIQKNIGPK